MYFHHFTSMDSKCPKAWMSLEFFRCHELHSVLCWSSNNFQMHFNCNMAKSCKWSKRDFVSESILLRFAKTILESSFHRFIMQHMSYNWKYKVLHRWELQFNFTIIQLAYFVMDKWTNRQAMLFYIYIQGKWIGFKIDNFLTLNCNFILVFFQDYYFISTSRPGMLNSKEGGYCAKNNMKVNSHEKYSSYQILGGLLWQIHQTHIPLKVVLLIHMKCFGFRKVCQN